MDIILKDKNSYVLRFNRGEEVVEGISDFCHQEAIDAAYFSMIGATQSVTLAYYNLDEKKYEDRELNERLEIAGATGNVSVFDGKTVVHAHGSFSDKELKVFGGHIKKILVSVTCEVVLKALTGTLNRSYDPEMGMNLLN